ncbi:MAG: LCP family protein [Actinomycetota bacterium]|nr:LCP family protein [Actinomycetota bacterium]
MEAQERQLPRRLDPRAGLRPRHRVHGRPGLGRVLALSVLGALIPGSAYLFAGRQRLGLATLSVFLSFIGAGVWLIRWDQRRLLHLLVDANSLAALGVGAVLLGVGWITVIVTGHLLLRPRGLRSGQRTVAAMVMATLCLGIALPAAVAANAAFLARDTLDEIFADDGRSATVPDGSAGDPFGDKERVNVLLLGGDGAPERDGVRTDSVIVASTDISSGATTLFSLPRNLEELPFPEGPLRDAYPDGFEGATESAGLLNAVYQGVPAEHSGILGPTDNLGADALKLGVGEALGLTIDYYLLINLDGFRTLVDILGGITVNINEWVPIGGDDSAGIRPDDYLTPGPNQLLKGDSALWYARGRYGLSDYSRMARQRCAMNAIIAAADPFTLLSRYQVIAETAPDLVLTDIPRSVLPAFVDLGVLVKDAEVRSLVFDDKVITPAYPDYDLIRSFVSEALAEPVANGGPAPRTTPAPTPTATPDPGVQPPAVTPAAEDVTSLCAYDPVAAQAALAEGKPRTRR